MLPFGEIYIVAILQSRQPTYRSAETVISLVFIQLVIPLCLVGMWVKMRCVWLLVGSLIPLAFLLLYFTQACTPQTERCRYSKPRWHTPYPCSNCAILQWTFHLRPLPCSPRRYNLRIYITTAPPKDPHSNLRSTSSPQLLQPPHNNCFNCSQRFNILIPNTIALHPPHHNRNEAPRPQLVSQTLTAVL